MVTEGPIWNLLWKGECMLGKQCPFAHKEEDLGTVELVLCGKVKTRICKMWKQGHFQGSRQGALLHPPCTDRFSTFLESRMIQPILQSKEVGEGVGNRLRCCIWDICKGCHTVFKQLHKRYVLSSRYFAHLLLMMSFRQPRVFA